MTISAHCLVKNEENYIWYAINSVIDYVDEILVWDTGSTDKTVDIIHSIKSPKIKFLQKGKADNKRISQLRLEMLEKTASDWILIIDGDEIWWREKLVESIEKIKKISAEVCISKVIMLAGDFYNKQADNIGKYKIGKYSGHYNIRLFKNVPGLKVVGNYPLEGYVNKEGIKLQDYPTEKMLYLGETHLHASNLVRSSKQNHKQKYFYGQALPKDYFYPESLFYKCPKLIANPWKKRSLVYETKARALQPVRFLKNII